MDSADNIVGLKGKGDKFAEKLFTGLKLPDYPAVLIKEYIQQFGEEEGVRQFYVNYKVLRMEENPPANYVIPSVIEVNYE